MKNIWLLDDTLRIRVYYDCDDGTFSDNICVSIRETASTEEKLLIADETNVYLTPAQAQELAQALVKAVNQSMDMPADSPQETK